MAYKTGYVDNTTATGPNTFAHHNMLDLIRRFCAGEGGHVITAQPGGTKGRLSSFRARSIAVNETITIVCTAAATNSGTFSVTGSVSGALAAATVGVPYANGPVSFTITDGATDYIVGDTFTVAVTANTDTIPHIVELNGVGNGTLGSFFAYESGQSEVWRLKATSSTNFTVTGDASGALAAATVGVAYNNGKVRFTINAGGAPFAAGDEFIVIPQIWKVLRWDDTGGPDAVRELIMVGNGYTGAEEIYVGFRTNHLVSADYYNLSTAFFTGYVPANTFVLQPGYTEVGFCGHNLRLDYWLIANGQRIAAGLKIATPVYEGFYVGKILPYGTPGQFPYPVVAIGTLTGQATTRFSETTHSIGYKGGATCKLRFIDASIKNPEAAPWNQFGSGPTPRDTLDVWPLYPIILNDIPQGLYGELEGVAQVTGFNNVAENTVDLDGTTWAVMQDTYRTGFYDYYALEMK